MNPQFNQGNAESRSDLTVPGRTQLWVGGIVVLEVFAATLFIVGLFDAACQPIGWASAVQVVLCASLGPVLWLADRRLERLASAPVSDLAICSRRTAI